MTTEPAAPFATLVQDALNAAATPEKIAAKVQAHVDKAVDQAIADAMYSYSDTGKVVKAALTDSLRVNNLNLPSYGHVVAQIVERQIQARVSEVVAAKLSADLENLLTLAPKRAKLSELVEELLGKEDEGGCSCDGPASIHFEVEWSDGSFCHVYISKEKPRSKWEADIRLMFHLPKKVDAYARGEAIEAPIWTGHVKGSDLKKDVRFGYGADYPKQKTEFGRWFGFEQKILAMYACGTVIEIDEDAVVTSRGDW
jgi:hypothetical protein